MTPPLTDAARASDLAPLGETGWRAVPDRDALRKVLKFRNFSQAWGFMSRAALAAEKLNHHPEWTNRFNIVDITLITHDCDGLSALDIQLAKIMDKISEGVEVVVDHSAPIDCLCKRKAP